MFCFRYHLRIVAIIGLFLGISLPVYSGPRANQIEKQVLKQILSSDFLTQVSDQKCYDKTGYHVVLIDNFDQQISLAPGVTLSHGEMVRKMLISGREDIHVTLLNTALSKGLAQVIQRVINGDCFDLVLSSTPGSNYTYGQISSLLENRVQINENNILAFKEQIGQLIRQIAIQGFPSVPWLEQLDINPAKLKNDAIKYLFIETLGRFSIPVILPYGNKDTLHRGATRNINLLSLSKNVKAYSGLDRNGKKISGFPYSPLSTGDAVAVYPIMECPSQDDPYAVLIDINDDGFFDFIYPQNQQIPYLIKKGKTLFTPHLFKKEVFTDLLSSLSIHSKNSELANEMVLTRAQFNRLKEYDRFLSSINMDKTYIWLNSKEHGRFFQFNAICRIIGEITGTSVIPPHKAKELLPKREKVILETPLMNY